MPIIRLAIELVLIAAFVLFAAFVVTRNKMYLSYLKQLLRYTGWLALIVGLLFLISRVIRL